jgi:cardiolipin synthase (CMP-forming)
MWRTLPNILTVFRVLLVPAMAVAFYLPKPYSHWVSAVIFVTAAVTDYLDGYLARLWQVQSPFGRMLDPIADKLLVITALVILMDTMDAVLWPIIPALVILWREILVSGLREFMGQFSVEMPVSLLAKYKTAIQMLAIFLLIIGSGLSDNLPYILTFGKLMLWIAAVLTVFTGYQYLKIVLPYILVNRKADE